jgi:hypothetical protein
VGETFTLSATATSGLSVSFSTTSSTCSVSSAGQVHALHVGSCTIQADQAGNDGYNAAPSVTQSFTITQGTATLALGNLTQTYNGNPRSVTVTTTPDGLSGVSVSYTGTGGTSYGPSTSPPTNAGSYGVAAWLTNADYTAQSISRTLTINRADQTINFAALGDKTFGDQDFDVSATATSALQVSFAVGAAGACTMNGTTIHLTRAGSCTVTASQGGNGNYNAAPSVSHTFAIAARPTSLAIAPAGVQYSDQVTIVVTFSGVTVGSTNSGGTVQFSLDGANVGNRTLAASAVSGGQLSFSLQTVVTKQPGSYTLAAAFTPSDASFVASSQTLPNGLTVTAEDARVKYTGATSVWTVSPASNSAGLLLSATVKDISAVSTDPATDASPGDIRTATLRFVDRGHGNATICTPMLVLVDPAVAKTATASCTYSVNLGTQSSVALSVGFVVGGNYTRNSSTDDATVQVNVARGGGTAYATGTLQTH